MLMRKKIIVIAALALAILLAACGTSAPKKQAGIGFIGWIIENRDPSLNTSSSASALLAPSVRFTDTELEASDFESIEIAGPTGRWTYDEAADFEENFSAENDRFYFPYLYDDDLEEGSYFALGDYTVKVTLKNGATATKTRLVPAPGSLETDGNEFVYTESYSGAANPPSGYVALPKRATIINATLDAQASTLDIEFSVDDATIYSGWLWFYNEADEYIGRTDFLKDYETGAVMAQLNADGELLNNGQTNTLALAASSEQLNLKEGVAFSDIASVSVVLTDGKQYADTKSSYDTRSRTAKFNVATIE